MEQFLYEDDLKVFSYNRALPLKIGKKYKPDLKYHECLVRFTNSHLFYDYQDDITLINQICNYFIQLINKYNDKLGDKKLSKEKLITIKQYSLNSLEHEMKVNFISGISNQSKKGFTELYLEQFYAECDDEEILYKQIICSLIKEYYQFVDEKKYMEANGIINYTLDNIDDTYSDEIKDNNALVKTVSKNKRKAQ